MELFPENLKRLWNLWEIRSLVLLSLSLQIILIVFGSRRKINNPQSLSGILFDAIVWCAYISADWVATISLSIIGSNYSHFDDGSSKTSNMLQALWAPFLLLHLGGPDTITAYSLEDNELWLRHFLGLIVQVGVAFYILLRFWSTKSLMLLSIPMFITGIVKYGERTWVLWSSSMQNLKDSLDSSPDLCIDFFGYQNREGRSPKLIIREGIGPEDQNLVEAYYSYKRLEHLFANKIINEYRYYSYSVISRKSAKDAFELVAIELGLMYDVLYTKAAIVYSQYGICLRCISLFFSVSTLVIFSIIIDTQSYPIINVMVTYLLLVGSILSEIYSLIPIFLSDWTKLWLVKLKVIIHNHSSKTVVENFLENFLRFTSHLHSCLANKKRWSESIGQYNLKNSVVKKRQHKFLGLEKLSFMSKMSEKHGNLTWENVDISLQETIFNYLKKIANELQRSRHNPNLFQKSRNELLSKRGEYALKRYGYDDPTVDEEYDSKILLWHIVTEEWYEHDLKHVQHNVDNLDQNCKISKWLSDYMLYLLLFRPSMLPKGIGQIRYEHTYVNAERAYKVLPSEQQDRANIQITSDNYPYSVFKRVGSLLSWSLNLKDDKNGGKIRWEIISEVWVEILAYAAQNCGWKEHAEQLRNGGELLTHVSVLMANFRLNKQVR